MKCKRCIGTPFQLIILVHICYRWNPTYLVNGDLIEEIIMT
jgi:hypothetical protein